jgi:hypothetical protein
MLQPAQNTTAIGTDPLFGRPTWSYVGIMAGPVRGPQPKLAQGSGRTGDPSLPGNAVQLPGYLSDNAYFPTLFPYDPVNQPAFQRRLPRTINTGDNGRSLVGTYEPHDVTIGQRFLPQIRQAPNWQVMEYPPNFRNLLAWQQVQRYRVNSFTLSARPLSPNDYFLGYQVNPDVAQNIGQSTLGYMGSM